MPLLILIFCSKRANSLVLHCPKEPRIKRARIIIPIHHWPKITVHQPSSASSLSHLSSQSHPLQPIILSCYLDKKYVVIHCIMPSDQEQQKSAPSPQKKGCRNNDFSSLLRQPRLFLAMKALIYGARSAAKPLIAMLRRLFRRMRY